MVREQHQLPGIDAGHVTLDATDLRRNGTRGPRTGFVASEASGLIAGPDRGSACVRVVTVDATECSVAFGVTLGLHDSDGLEPSETGNLGTEPSGEGLIRMSVALAAERHLG